MLFKYYDALTNASGDSLVGYALRLFDSNGAAVPLFADESMTPIISVSGKADTAISDDDGMIRFYVESGTYDIRKFDPNDAFIGPTEIAVPMIRGLNEVELAGDDGASLVGSSSGDTVQESLDARPTAAALGAPTGGEMIGSIDEGAGALATDVQEQLRRLPIDPRNYGAILDGTTDDGDALRDCLAAAASTGRPIHIPRGKTLLFTDQGAFDTGIDIIPAAGTLIYGDGPTSVLKFKRTAFSSSYGLSIKNDNFAIRDLKCVVDINGGAGFAATVAITGENDGFTAERVHFEGLITPILATPSGQYAVLSWFADASNMLFDKCIFRKLDFGYVKTTNDPSTQTGFRAVDCYAKECQEVFEFNSPGILNATSTIGQPTLTSVSTGTTNLAAGQKIKSPALPDGTTIVSVDSSSQITVSQNAIAAGTNRFSVGTMTGIRIVGLRGEDILQWGIGLANCRDVDIDCQFDGASYEGVHIEDHSENVRVRISGSRMNTEPGVPLSPGADNGAVQVVAGCKDVIVTLLNIDLTQSDTGSRNGLVVQPADGGTAGTTNTNVASSGIAVAGRVIMNDGCTAVIAGDTDVDYSDFKAESPDSASKADPVTKMTNCSWSGRISVLNPGTLVETDDAAMGLWSEVRLATTETGYPDLIWSSGFFAANRNAPPLLSKVFFDLPSTADASPTWRTLCPAPRTLVGSVSRKYVGGQHAYEVGTFNINGGAIVPTDVYVETNSIDLTPGSGSPKQTDDGWRINSGNLQFRAYANPAIDCQVRIALTGDLFPAA